MRFELVRLLFFSPCTCSWFEGFDWTGLEKRTLVPPIIPNVSKGTGHVCSSVHAHVTCVCVLSKLLLSWALSSKFTVLVHGTH